MTTPAATDLDLTGILSRQRAAFQREGPPPLRTRLDDLDRLARAITGHQAAFVESISTDFGYRSPHETMMLELATILEGIRYLRHHLRRWMRPERRQVAITFQPASNRVLYQPIGVVGIISPWNYPASLESASGRPGG